MFPPRQVFHVLLPNGGVLVLGERPLVMGILNLTPDSFAGDGLVDAARAVDVGLAMVEAGADLLDVGGESTRPGSEPVDEAEEQRRVLPVVRALAAQAPVPISIDTYKAGVARAALDVGAAIVNDVSGLRYEPALAGVVATGRAALVLMHTRGRSRDMYDEAIYADLMHEVTGELQRSIGVATAAGVGLEQLIVDPGIGFAKRAAHSYGVLARLPELAASLGRPLLSGPSRKSFMRDALGDRPPAERDWGTAAAVTASVLAGAHIIRVHAVSEMVQVVRVAEQIRRHAGPMQGRG